MSRTEQTAVSPPEQKPDGEFEYNFYQMFYELFEMFQLNLNPEEPSGVS